MTRNDLLINNPLLIVDVGASGGIDPRWARSQLNYKGVLFEPDPREYNILRSKSGKNLIVLNAALSDSPTTLNFHLCKKQQVSSVYLPNVDFLEKFPDIERFDVTKSIEMRADTLSNQLKLNDIAEIDFIKIDTQGHELPILNGGDNYLDNVIGLELEVEFVPLYKNQPLFSEVDNFVRAKGFELFDIKRTYWKRKESINSGNKKGQLIFGDALYLKSPEQVLLMNGITQEKIAKSIGIYLAYGYLDLAQSLFNNAETKGLLEKEFHDTIMQLLSKVEKRNVVLNFRGKRRVKKILEKLMKVFFSGGSFFGTDTLGNP